jgi:SARP family transcriptional regulator, regulator of embCAB operon
VLLSTSFPKAWRAVGTRIQICGSVVVQVDGRRVEGELPGRQGQMLLVYLAANRDRAVSRDELIEALWPRELPARPESALSVLLSKLRSVLGPASIEGRSQVRLALRRVSIDLEAASAGVHDAESAVAREDWPGVWAPARVALHTTSRGVLPGLDAPWILDLRARLDDIRLRALSCVAVSSLRMGGPELPAAERAARTLVALAPYRETGHQFLMQALAAQGDTAEALRVFEALRRRLKEDLGTVPGPELRALHRRLLADADAGPAPADPAAGGPAGTVTIVFTDIEGSTEIAERLGDRRWVEVLARHEGTVRRHAAAHGGHEVKSQGDGLMLAFPGARRAIDFAVALQRELAGDAAGLRVRIGLHTGEAIRQGDDYVGRTVIVAARIAAQCAGGQIAVSDLVKRLVDSAGDLSFDEGRDVILKGLRERQRVHTVRWQEAVPARPSA